jgi:Ran GTPase-activating protein (RanGAP) involved in mRNA processing and transport
LAEQIKNAREEAIKEWKPRVFRLINEKVKDTDMDLLVDTLITARNIKTVHFIQCEITVKSLLIYLRSLPAYNLEGLYILKCKLNDMMLKILSTGVQATNIKKLDVSWNAITDKGCQYIASALRDCPLEALNLNSNLIGPLSMSYLGTALSRGGTALRLLDLGNNQMIGGGVCHLIEALPHTIIETLLMSACGLGQDDVIALFNHVADSQTIQWVDVSQNRISDICTSAIANAISRCATLTRVALRSNLLTDAGISILADGIRQSNTMEHMDLRFNAFITSEAVRVMMNATRTHRTLQHVSFHDTITNANVIAELTTRLKALHTERAKITVTICSMKMIPRLGVKSPLQAFPQELLRPLAVMLG